MGIAVTRTKIRVPRRRADLLSRPRLDANFADLLDYPFTLISAPAGYGKTCLMIDLAHRASYPTCWYSLDPLDQDPKRFLAHFVHAIQLEFPDFGKPTLDLLNNLPDPLSPPDQFIATLVNDIYQAIPENFALFLDDFHLLGDQPQINGFISRFGQQMDENTHLVLASRERFNIPDLPLLIGRKLVKGIDQADLAFHPGELRDYFQETLQQSLSEQEAEEMIANTAGWITGLLLKKDNVNSPVPDQDKAASVTGADLDDYFADQVFEIQPAPVRALMLKTSLFDEFNTRFCQQVLGEPDGISWPEFLDALTERNLFVEQVEDNGIWVRYHHLFRDFLKRGFEQRHPGEMRRLLGRMVQIHLQDQHWEQAFVAARRLEDPRLMAEVIELAFGPLFHAGRIKLLADWLDTLPDEIYTLSPNMGLFKGILYTSLGNPKKGLEQLNTTLKNDSIRNNLTQYYRGLICRATTQRILGNCNEALNDLKIIYTQINGTKVCTNLLAEAQREAALCKNHLGNYIEAICLFKESLSSYKSINDINNSALVHSDLGCVLMAHGQLSQAEIHFSYSREIWTRLGNSTQLSIILNNLATLSLLTGNYEKSNELLGTAEKKSIQTHNSRIHSFIIGTKADLALFLSSFELAISTYLKAEEIADAVQEIFLLYYLQIAQSTCYRYQKEYTQSQNNLNKIYQTVSQVASKFELGLWHLEWGYTHLAQSMLDIAQAAFLVAQDIFAGVSKPYEQAKSLLGLCLVADARDKATHLAMHLDKLQNILAELETIHPLLPEFSQQREGILRIASRQPDSNGFHVILDQINRYRQQLPEFRRRIYPRTAIPSRSPGLDLKAFGEVSVRKDGKRVTASEWVHQKTVREILFYLLLHPNGVSRDQLGLIFWPNSSPSQFSCQFKNAIYRLRRAIGADRVLYHQETRTYTFNKASHYTFDVEEFQQALQLANYQIEDVYRLEYLRQGVSFYQHPLAPQLDGTWAEPIRRKLYLAYEKAQLELAAYDLNTGNYSNCKDICLSILEIEPCQEKACQLCMKAYANLDEIINVVRTFNNCKEKLHSLLNTKPRIDTISIYEQIMNIYPDKKN